MSKIRVMKPNLANKIAAGEVIERISNIVKELVENSIDASSKTIKIDLLDAGKTMVRVVDDGIGMDEVDAENSFLRHATSKIYKDDDLFFINTLGFRGEALASIAAVSSVEMETCDGDSGTKIVIKGGELLEKTSCPLRRGTSITVKDLFYNTPARLKYLKSEPYELALVTAFVEKLSLSYPDISFKLTNNQEEIIRTSGSGDLLKTIHEIFGPKVSSNMIPINGSNDDYDVNGYVSNISVLRKTKNKMITIINGRAIWNNDINKMIEEAYHTYKPEDMHPITVINILTDPTLIDVNIHPTKQDIRISKKEELKEVLVGAIKDALYNELLVPDAISNEDTLESNLPSNLFKEESEVKPLEINLDEKIEESSVIKKSFFKNVDFESEQKELDFKIDYKNEKLKKIELYPVGIAFGTYIIAQNKEGLFIIDQHAAQERVNYEKTLNELKSNKSIDMLVPINIELSKSDFIIVKNNLSVLEDLGFEIEEFGINTFKINSHPIWLKDKLSEENIKDIFDILIETNGKFDMPKFMDNVAATVACKMSIKGNSRITLEEASFLLDELVLCDNPYNCPHGRPTIIKFTVYELEKMFKRAM